MNLEQETKQKVLELNKFFTEKSIVAYIRVMSIDGKFSFSAGNTPEEVVFSLLASDIIGKNEQCKNILEADKSCDLHKSYKLANFINQKMKNLCKEFQAEFEVKYDGK